MRINPLLFLAPAMGLALLACSNASIVPSDSPGVEIAGLTLGENGEGLCTPLYAGQHIDAGTVCVNIDANDDLVVTYTTTGGWELVETHLWVGLALSDMPQTKSGNPQVGQFPHTSGDITGATTVSFTVDLDQFGISQDACPDEQPPLLYAAAHTALRKLLDDGSYQTETGWGFGERLVARGNWATYFAFQILCSEDDEPPVPVDCETAFALLPDAGICLEDNYGIQRWGWTNPIESGSFHLDLWAAAAHCDTWRGTLVGQLEVIYGETLTIHVSTLPGFTLDEVHYFAGVEPLPVDNQGDYTVAPGRFPVNHDLDYLTATFDSATFEGLEGGIYVVVHAVACGEFEAPSVTQ